MVDQSNHSTVYLVDGVRTPIGSFQGSLSDVPAPQLGAAAIQGLMERQPVQGKAIDQVLMGCVLPAGIGQAPARQAMVAAGMPYSVGAMTVNKVCGSGLKTVMMARSDILAGESHLAVAGGMESMSQVPYYLPQARTGFRMGHQKVVDGMIHDGLWDPYNHFHMGNAAEQCVGKYQFSREDQDAFALQSYERARQAMDTQGFQAELVAVEVPQRKGEPLQVMEDEQPYKDNLEKLPTLRPAFQREGGTVTAGNASTLNDGAAALLVASQEAVSQHALTPRAKILATSTFSQEPVWFTTAPVGAIQQVLAKANLSPEDIDLYEINEAFAAVTMAAMADLKLPHDRVNVRGGAIALGHPIGASGARILVTLLHSLCALDKTLGVAAICLGGGEAVAVLIERV